MTEKETPPEFVSPRVERTDFLPAKLEIARTMREAAAQLQRQIAEASESLRPFVQQVSAVVANFHKHLAPTLATIAQAVERLPAQTRTHLSDLAKAGWYLEPGMDLHQLAEYRRLLEQVSADAANDAMNQYYAARSDGIERELCANFPDRTEILHAAFRAYRAKEYALAVPIFFGSSRRHL